MQTHEKVGLAVMAAAEGARAGKDIYTHIRHVRRLHRSGHRPTPRPRKHFNWAMCAIVCVCAVIPAVFYGSEAFIS